MDCASDQMPDGGSGDGSYSDARVRSGESEAIASVLFDSVPLRFVFDPVIVVVSNV